MKRTIWLALALAIVTSLAFAGVAMAAAGGSTTVRDDKARADKLDVSLTGLTAPAAGTAYVGWLVSDDGKTMTNIGPITVDAAGNGKATFTSPKGENLIGLYSKLIITTEQDADKAGAAPKGQTLLELPGPATQALMHVRHVAYQWDAAPNKTGFAIGELTQATLLSQHANFALDAVKAGNMALAKTHAEHVINIVEGSKGPNFGDKNGDGQAQNPGDGFGLLEYAKGAAEHATFAAGTPDATAYVKLHAGHVADTANNVVTWATAARDKALDLLKANDAAAALPIATDMAKNGDLAFKGNSTKPAKGEGGAMTTWEHAQNMGAFVAAVATTAAPAPAPATTAAPAALPKSGTGLPLDLLALLGSAAAVSGLALRRLGKQRVRK